MVYEEQYMLCKVQPWCNFEITLTLKQQMNKLQTGKIKQKQKNRTGMCRDTAALRHTIRQSLHKYPNSLFMNTERKCLLAYPKFSHMYRSAHISHLMHLMLMVVSHYRPQWILSLDNETFMLSDMLFTSNWTVEVLGTFVWSTCSLWLLYASASRRSRRARWCSASDIRVFLDSPFLDLSSCWRFH